MANAFYTPAEAAAVLASLANQDATLASMVSRNFQDDLLGGGKGGAPVSLIQPTTLVARSRAIDDVTNSIVMDEITENRTTLNLSRVHDYSAVPLSEKDMTLNLKDFASQVLAPQAAAIVDLLEYRVLTALQAVPETLTIGWNASSPIATFTAIRKMLRDNGVDASGLQVVVGTEIYAALLDAQAVTNVGQSGSADALRNANVGMIRGFNIMESNRLADDEIIAFHKDAVTLVTRAPVVPAGASFGAVVNAQGFSMRYLRDYLAEKTVDRSLVSTFAAVGILPTYKVTRTYGSTTTAGQSMGGTSALTAVPNGGVIRVLTSTVPA